MTRRYAIGSLAFLAMLGLAGCGGGPPTGDVSGTAAFEGVPIAEGSITFHPLDGKGSVVGDKIVDGRYAVKKAPLGPCRVQITSSKEVGKKKMYNTPNSPEMPVKIDPLPKRFNDPLESELRFDVQAGSQEKNWDLK